MSGETQILLNLLKSENPDLELVNLDKSGVLSALLPELTNLKGVDKVGKLSHKDNFIHTLQVIKQTKEASNDPWMILIAILHDIGKFNTKHFTPGFGFSFHDHENVSANQLDRLFTKFELDRTNFERVFTVVKLHGKPKQIVDDGITESAIRRFDKEAGDYLEDLILFCKCDITTRFEEKRDMYIKQMDYLYSRVLEVRELDKVRNYQIPVDGIVLMKDFGLKGKSIGDIKTKAKELVLSGELKGDYESVYNWIKENV